MRLKNYIDMVRKNIVYILLAIAGALVFTIYTISELKLDNKLYLWAILMCVSFVFFLWVTKNILDKISVVNALYVFLCSNISLIYYFSLKKPQIQFDTWQVYDMSRYIFDDFGYMDMIRQHIVNSHYEMAFPPLFPLLFALVNKMFNMGVMAAVVINYMLVLTLIVILKKIGEQSKNDIVLIIVSIALVCNYDFFYINVGGVTQIMGYIILAIIVYFVQKTEYTIKHSYLCSILAGLGIMNRFDFIPVMLCTVMLTPFIVKHDMKEKFSRLKNIIINIGIVCIISLPWIIYSLARFNKLFVTDNGRRLINIVDTRPSTYFPKEYPALTVFNDFTRWLNVFLDRCLVPLKVFKELSFRCHYLFFVSSITILIYVVFYFVKNKGYKRIRKYVSDNLNKIIVLFIFITQQIAFIITGYGERRYHLAFIFYLNVVVISEIVKLIRRMYLVLKEKDYTLIKKEYAMIALCLGISVLCLDWIGSIGFNYKYYNPKIIYDRILSNKKNIELSDKEKRIKEYLNERNVNCLLIYRNEKEIDIPRFCALVRETTILSPTNLDRENMASFVKDFNVDYIYSSDEEFNELLAIRYRIKNTELDNLYKMIKE